MEMKLGSKKKASIGLHSEDRSLAVISSLTTLYPLDFNLI